MKAGNIVLDGDRAYYTYRGKGGKQGHRELPRPALNAIRASLGAFGKDLATMPPDESLWPSPSHHSKGITSGTSSQPQTAVKPWMERTMFSSPSQSDAGEEQSLLSKFR